DKHVDRAAEKWEPVARWTGHENYVSALACVNCGAKRLVISGSYDRRLIWWDAGNGRPVRSVEAHQGWVRDLAALPDGSRLVSAGDDKLIKVWETETGRLIRTVEGHAKRSIKVLLLPRRPAHWLRLAEPGHPGHAD